MKNIAFSHYLLHPKSATSASRMGALLRIQFPDDSIGYADCHPWETLGDLPLETQLSLLKKRQMTALTQQSVYFANLDAQARKKGVSLFANSKIPESHYLLMSLLNPWEDNLSNALQEGFTHFKIKLGKQLDKELPQLLHILSSYSIRIRLDFNASLTPQSFLSLVSALGESGLQIDFFEDPFPFDPNTWKAVQKEIGSNLACDHNSQRAISFRQAAPVLVLKPAVQPWEPFVSKSSRKLVVTSYLDHPLGQCCAAYVASKCAERASQAMSICGLLSHRVYQTNEFSSQLTQQGPQFIAPPGTGFGFDDLLESQHWEQLR